MLPLRAAVSCGLKERITTKGERKFTGMHRMDRMERTKMARFRTAILGCGGRGRAHAAGYAAAPNAEIIACADPVAENARTLAERYKVSKTYADYRRLLEEQRPEVVSVCTWPALHREMVEAAIAAGVKAI